MRVERRVATVGDYPVRYKVAGSRWRAGEFSSMACQDRRAGGRRTSRRWQGCIASIWLICQDSARCVARHLRQGVQAATDWLIRWIEAVGAQPAHLVGHSMGGHICLRIAIERPDLVNRLALVAPAVWFVRGSLLARIAPLVDETRQFSPRFMATLSYDALRAGPITLLRSARDLLREDVARDLTAIQAPTLLIWGEHDALVPVLVGYELRRLIPQSRLLVLKDANHVPMFHDARRFNAALLHFLRGDPIGV